MTSDGVSASESWLIELYVVGATPRSRTALDNLRTVCAASLEEGRYSIEVIDLREYPEEWRAQQILATPTAIRRSPQPERRVIGDLSRFEQVVRGLELPSARAPGSSEAEALGRDPESRR
jgi:circadian clock protein KaiB